MKTAINTFQRLQVELAAIIENTPAGDRLPSEPSLARQLNVSRATLREAMRGFESQGLIRRHQGLGTFVLGPTPIIESGLETLESLEHLAKRINLDVKMGTLAITQTQADKRQAEIFNMAEGDALIQISRVIKTKNRPVAFLIDTLPHHVLTSSELDKGFTGSVLDFLIQRGSPKLSTSKTEISAIVAPTEVAKALEIQRGDTLLQLQALLFTINNDVIDISSSYFLPGYFRFHVVRKVGQVVPSF